MRIRRALLLFVAIAGLLQMPATLEGAQGPAQNADVWRPIRFMLGTWDTTSSGQPGSGTGTREYRLILDDRFIESRTRVTYPPQEKNPKGDPRGHRIDQLRPQPQGLRVAAISPGRIREHLRGDVGQSTRLHDGSDREHFFRLSCTRDVSSSLAD